MVLDAAFYASTVVSLMMEGVCFAYEMQKEEEKREQLRRDIREECERQRMQDREMWEQQSQSFYAHSPSGSESSFVEKRRERRQKRVFENMTSPVNISRRYEAELDASFSNSSDAQEQSRRPKRFKMASSVERSRKPKSQVNLRRE